jgi:hypothetical protein
MNKSEDGFKTHEDNQCGVFSEPCFLLARHNHFNPFRSHISGADQPDRHGASCAQSEQRDHSGFAAAAQWRGRDGQRRLCHDGRSIGAGHADAGAERQTHLCRDRCGRWQHVAFRLSGDSQWQLFPALLADTDRAGFPARRCGPVGTQGNAECQHQQCRTVLRRCHDVARPDAQWQCGYDCGAVGNLRYLHGEWRLRSGAGRNQRGAGRELQPAKSEFERQLHLKNSGAGGVDRGQWLYRQRHGGRIQ